MSDMEEYEYMGGGDGYREYEGKLINILDGKNNHPIIAS